MQYWGYKEDQRHNLQTEGEMKRHNVVSEQQNAVTIGENIRHNKQMEYETNRHNVVGEQLGFATLDESRRHNITMEHESHRHNVATEGIQKLQASASMVSAQAAATNAATNASKAESEIKLNEAHARYTDLSGARDYLDYKVQQGKQKSRETLAPVTGILEGLGLSNMSGVVSQGLKGLMTIL